MTDELIQRELLSFASHISLAELEEAKAHERTMELKYQLSQFQLNAFLQMMKEAQCQQQESAAATSTPKIASSAKKQ